VLGDFFAKALINVCRKCDVSLDSIDLIGSHGQTICHNPQGTKYAGKQIRSTLQIGEPTVIARQTGITTVADFRPGDIVCGGQGAPLVPFADFILFGHRKSNRVLQNIGGISNLTFLRANGSPDDIIAFDTGPGNMIIDGLAVLITNNKKKYDRSGAMAAKGRINKPLMREMLRHPYFRKCPPKTCGREEFGLDYCRDLYKKAKAKHIQDIDLLATATAFTARTITRAYEQFLPSAPDEIILCGGGCRNKTLVNMLAHQLHDIKILTTGDFGIDPDAKEAVSFAILAWATIKGIPNNIPSATGAEKSNILGKIVCTS
jgi:anhydro-N-acetylmuramic acid kinase